MSACEQSMFLVQEENAGGRQRELKENTETRKTHLPSTEGDEKQVFKKAFSLRQRR